MERKISKLLTFPRVLEEEKPNQNENNKNPDCPRSKEGRKDSKWYTPLFLLALRHPMDPGSACISQE